ncbi:hypothetical protein pb186bvf_001902 [Paramecium bursaria]
MGKIIIIYLQSSRFQQFLENCFINQFFQNKSLKKLFFQFNYQKCYYKVHTTQYYSILVQLSQIRNKLHVLFKINLFARSIIEKKNILFNYRIHQLSFIQIQI